MNHWLILPGAVAVSTNVQRDMPVASGEV